MSGLFALTAKTNYDIFGLSPKDLEFYRKSSFSSVPTANHFWLMEALTTISQIVEQGISSNSLTAFALG